MVRPSASNNLQSKQTWRSLTFIETSDPVHWFQFSSPCSVFTDRQVLRFRFNNEEKFLLGLLLLVLAAPGLATDGWLELITLNGENIIWPYWFSPRGCVPPYSHGRWNASRLGRGQKPCKERTQLKTRHGFHSLAKLGTLHCFININQWSTEKHRVTARTRKTTFYQWNCSQRERSSSCMIHHILFQERTIGRLHHELDCDKPKGELLSQMSF